MPKSFKTTTISFCFALTTIGCAAIPQQTSVSIDLRYRENTSAQYQPVKKLKVTKKHEIGDGMFPYEGIGWENQFVGYRMYLDSRAVIDIFGKKTAPPALQNIQDLGTYHALADWGMDVLKVGNTLGMGGLGVLRNGSPEQFTFLDTIDVEILEETPNLGRFKVDFKSDTSKTSSDFAISAEYKIAADSPMTFVDVSAPSDLNLASGIVHHENTDFLQSTSGQSWRYIATFGNQSENQDALGMALFYNSDTAIYEGNKNNTHFVKFLANDFQYSFLATWAQDKNKISDLSSFKKFIDAELKSLNNTPTK